MTTKLETPHTGLYIDPETGRRISTNSMLKTFRRCAKQADYKYAQRLKPKTLGKPLKRGKWFHSVLEWYHTGRDWQEIHAKYCNEFSHMFDEEKEYYGDLPREIEHIMESYIWHYANDIWVVHQAEVTLETTFPDGTIFRGKADEIVENEFGLWIVDHKTHAQLPDFAFRLLDTQSPLYVWTARRSKIPVNGFIWNYVRWKAPSVPRLLKDGTRLSKTPCDTDYPTYTTAIKEYKRTNPNFKITKEYVDHAAYLKSLRYIPGEMQKSTFFRRDVLERTDETLKTVALENYRTSTKMHEYDFGKPGVERTIDRSCSRFCAYSSLCMTELIGGNTDLIRKQNFTIGDPNDYYQDEPENSNG